MILHKTEGNLNNYHSNWSQVGYMIVIAMNQTNIDMNEEKRKTRAIHIQRYIDRFKQTKTHGERDRQKKAQSASADALSRPSSNEYGMPLIQKFVEV